MKCGSLSYLSVFLVVTLVTCSCYGRALLYPATDEEPDGAVAEYWDILPDGAQPEPAPEAPPTNSTCPEGIRPFQADSVTVVETISITCAEGTTVIPQTNLHLGAATSSGKQYSATAWQWTVRQPEGSKSVFVPASTHPNPTFQANMAGMYVFSLELWGMGGTPAPHPAVYEVEVIPDEAIHVELLWHNPEDPDETDTGPEAGADMDLHFKHPWAAGPDLDGDGESDGWFDIPFDAFWFNAHPNWGSYDPAIDDDPGLDRDDTDGAGPENINIDIPEGNVTYVAGVHYWNDHGYGPALTRVRVFIYGKLIYEANNVLLNHSDMWEVCTIEWPSGKVKAIALRDGQPKITPDYDNPYFGN